MKRKLYQFKVGQRVKTSTGYTGKVLARYHPGLNHNGYVVLLDDVFYSIPHKEKIQAMSFAEYFISAAA